jgi:hypothetical protein
VTDTRQETGRKRWFTSGRTIATGAVAAVAVIAGLLTNIKTIVDWFELSRPADIHIRDLMVRATYPVNLYDFSHQAPRAAWARTIPPIDKGYVAQLYLRAEKRGGDAAEGCIVQEMHGAKPMWKWLEAEPPPNSTSEHDGQFYVLSDALAFIGVDNYSVGYFKRGEDAKDVEFEVFFREKKSIRVRLACRGKDGSRTNPLQGGPTTIWLQEELKEPVDSPPRVFRARGHPWLMEFRVN